MNTRKACIVSVILHGVLLALVFTNWLKWTSKQTELITPMPVDVETFADISQSPNPIVEALKTDEPPKEEIVKETPPDQAEPEPESTPNADEKLSDNIVEDIDDEPVPDIKPSPKPVEPPKAIQKPKVEKPKVEKKLDKKPIDKPKPMDAMSILKNLQQSAKSTGNSKSAPAAAQSGQGGTLSDQLTASELDRVRRQIESMWNVPGAIQNAHTIVVSIQIQINQDRTVRSARILNREKMNDVTFRTMAESALRAVSHFKDRPLLLSPEKYSIWKEVTINFDPRDLL